MTDQLRPPELSQAAKKQQQAAWTIEIIIFVVLAALLHTSALLLVLLLGLPFHKFVVPKLLGKQVITEMEEHKKAYVEWSKTNAGLERAKRAKKNIWQGLLVILGVAAFVTFMVIMAQNSQ